MTSFIHPYIAATSGGLLGALGIDWKALVFNAIAFLIILGLLGKYVYPVLNKALDAKADELNSATKLQQAAEAKLAEAEVERQAILARANVTADKLVDDAKAEAGETVKQARVRASAEADRILAEAREDLDRDVAAARRILRAETAQLVVQATEIVVGEKLDPKRDEALINRSLEITS
jgi:F-type H+-transporting ATPase subunit b